MFTILVVDDDADVLDSVTMLLEDAFRCARVVTASDGVQALELAAAVQPDLIISDYAMPTMDGATFVRHARREPALRQVPIVMFSSEPALADLAGWLDVQAVVGKTDVLQLPAVVRSVLPQGCGRAVA